MRCWFFTGLILARVAFVQGAAAPAGVQPTHADVAYGSHERQVLDVYVAPAAAGPTPIYFHIHGGGWVTGDKRSPPGLEEFLRNGISVVSINYRYAWKAQLEGIWPPVEAPVRDAARALQHVRSRAAEWGLDRARVVAGGGSAGACSSLWLVFREDLAEPGSPDPVSRESTRLSAVAAYIGQTSLDPAQLVEWTPNSRYGGHAFGFMDPTNLKLRDTQFAEFLALREKVLPWIKEYSPLEWVTPDDPPVYLLYNSAPELGQPQKDPTHTANYGVKLEERCREKGVSCELVYPGAPGVRHPTVVDFVRDFFRPAR